MAFILAGGSLERMLSLNTPKRKVGHGKSVGNLETER